MTAPLTPPDCDLRDFPRMMIDIPRLFGSGFDAKANDTEWRFGVTLWLKSFHLVPAAHLPDDDGQLAKMCGLGRDLRSWRKAKAGALRGWLLCDDGNLYHPVVAEVALEAWIDKLLQRLSSGAGNAARWGVEFDPSVVEAEIGAAAGMLRALNPKSRTLSKQKVVVALKRSDRQSPSAIPTAVPSAVPPGPEKRPAGIPREGKGREEEKSSESDDSDAEASRQAEAFDVIRSLGEPGKRGWDGLAFVLMARGRLTGAKARSLIGKLVKDGVTPEQLWDIAEAAWTAGTRDPVAYITKAAEGTVRRSAAAAPVGGITDPSERQQRAWMEDWLEFGRPGWRQHERGPYPGEEGCRVDAEIQRRHGVAAFGDPPADLLAFEPGRAVVQ